MADQQQINDQDMRGYDNAVGEVLSWLYDLAAGYEQSGAIDVDDLHVAFCKGGERALSDIGQLMAVTPELPTIEGQRVLDAMDRIRAADGVGGVA